MTARPQKALIGASRAATVAANRTGLKTRALPQNAGK